MLSFESDNGFRKVRVWNNEVPFSYNPSKKLKMTIDSGKYFWNEEIICIEARLNPRHASNYAMVCVKYIRTQSDNTNIIINYGNCGMDNVQNELFNKNAVIGLDDYFADAIYEFFQECPKNIIPNGTIEVIGGAYDEIGSSNSSFKYIMELLMWIFINYNKINEDSFGDKLLSKIYEDQYYDTKIKRHSMMPEAE